MEPGLFMALRKGDVRRIRTLISENPNPRLLCGITVQKNTALHITAGLGHAGPVVEIIYNRHPEFLLAVNSKGDTPLHCAARAGHPHVVSFLINSAKSQNLNLVEIGNGCGNTALHEAVRNGRMDAARVLLIANAELGGLVNNSGESPLYLAAEMGALGIAKLLLQFPMCVGGPNGQTALHAAAFRSYYEISELLLEAIPNLNLRGDASQSAPLHYAASMGDKRMVQLLLQNDASTAHLLDKDGLSPIHIAASLGYIDIIDEILQHCPDALELTDKNGGNLLHVAAEKKRSKVVKYVLKTPALEELINDSDQEGNTPLHLATMNHNQEIVHLLLEDGRAKTSPRNHKGLTPLDLASSCVDSGIRLRMHSIVVQLVSAGSQFSPQRMDLVTNKLHRKKEEEIHRCRALANNLAIVAVLIATVTFSAAFTLPGGYKNDNGSNQGMAVLAKKAAFKAFLISDAIAMVSSITVACLLIYTGSRDHDVRLHSINTAMKFMWVALGGMVVAFAMGTYVVVDSECNWLAILICAMACSVPFIAWMITCWPAFNHLKLVKIARSQGGEVRKSAVFKVLDFQMPHSMVADFETPLCSTKGSADEV